ncbi:virion structural protein [Synechococcus phage ACG-2014f]|uniref:Virion structural protein n=1 Tax=Synechococcus phage ACG-2014f TaxID=1493511 RepID=A0A0E3I7U7_9CAUD|nr:virion structural protein [Synechococcus phage ACG-2014f]AIX30011.1 virion structural protein [Synechococcus phage ACG-2014f]AIX41477.1 virion structural protein [Synechococcus phage ACG-2014f]
MSQINLDTSPYFDDFDPSKDYYKVLFKPGFPVQARELTTLQSILQNQVSNFGKHLFKEGSMVIPGSITYNAKYESIVINKQQGGIDVSLYASRLVGKTIQGKTSGVTAKVINFLLPPNNGVTSPTIFVSYINSGSDAATTVFDNNEELISTSDIVYGNTTITAGTTFASTISTLSTAVGSAAQIRDGIYFIRGFFAQVRESVVILEPFSNTPSYRVGLQITEQVITAGQDNSLYDNAKGFNNFSAPGADRLKISTKLIKKPLDDYNDTNFVELLRVDNGEVKKIAENSDYNIIKDYLAQRTYEESGDYTLFGMGIKVAESLSDNLGNGGVYQFDQKTEQGGTPTDDLAVVKVSAGKAYVRGYDINNPGTVNLDINKPRTTENVEASSVPFEMGSKFFINNVTGTPVIGLDVNDNIVELYNGRVDGAGSSTGDLIGESRVYSYSLEDAPYTGPSTPWNLYLYDTQIFTKLTLNVDATGNILTSYKVRGLSSNATGYVRSVSTTEVVLTQVSGEFIRNEAISVNGKISSSLSVSLVDSYRNNDVRSISQASSSLDPNIEVDFSADTLQYSAIPTGFTASDSVTITTGGVVTCPGRIFDAFRVGDVIGYQKAGSEVITYNQVLSLNATNTSITVDAVANVAGVCDGTLPSSETRSGIRLYNSRLLNQEISQLYATLEERNISSVDLASSSLTFAKQINNLSTDASGVLTVNVSDLDVSGAVFEAFDQERYSIHYSNGTTQSLSSSQVTITSSTAEFTNLLPSQTTNVTLNCTAIKTGIKSKTKVLLRSQLLEVTKASSGISTVAQGLGQNDYYGLRVDDEEISLNVSDVTNIVAVYESLDDGTPTFDVLGFVNGLELDTRVAVGEQIKGDVSGAIARVVTVATPASVNIVYLTESTFEVGELVTFMESKIETNLQSITEGNYSNITNRFTLDKGQREQFYDYSRLVRNKNAKAPNKRILIIYDRFAVPVNDKGDFYTANSYSEEDFSKGVPMLAGGTLRASDTLDFRPRVAAFTSLNSSPFNYTSRDFGDNGNTVILVTKPSESMVLGYSYFVGRRDRIVLGSNGKFSVIEGTPAEFPTLPTIGDGVMELAQITYPPYLYYIEDVQIIEVDNRRYTMRDIGKLEDRIENLEEVTSLSLLERETESLQVLDEDGNDRFKSGFFADDFTNAEFIDNDYEDTNIDVEPATSSLVTRQLFSTIPLRAQLSESIDENIVDLSDNLPLVDTNLQKTGDIVTLSYVEVPWITQPLSSRTENVNPFNVILFNGSITLNPASDDFVITRQIPGNTQTIDVFGDGNSSNFDQTFVESVETAQWMRSRNIAFHGRGIKPFTQFYAFFDGTSGIDIIPKLIEITMTNGAFSVGERVVGTTGGRRIFAARVATPNHKEGTFNSPDRTFETNPYNRDAQLASSYSASSTVLNIDTNSLADITDSRFFGYITPGTRLVGQSSGAIADVTEVKLIADTFAELYGAIWLRDPYASPTPSFRLATGVRTLKLTSSTTNAQSTLGGTTISFAESNFQSSGLVQNRQTDTTVVTVRPLPPPPPPIIIDQTVTIVNNNTTVIDNTVTQNIDNTQTIIREVEVDDDDPLAQTFMVDETGAFLTSIDLFMATKSETDNLIVQVRTTELATPTNLLIQDFAEVVLSPDQVNVSEDGTAVTKVTFPSPIYLESGITYAVVLLAPTTDEYTSFIAVMGEENISGEIDPNLDLNATLPEGSTQSNSNIPGTAIISQQYLGGSLFKSQNGTIWTPTQFEDLKFTLNKAQFNQTPGTLFLNNPPLTETGILPPDPIETLPRKLKVSVSSNTYNFSEGDIISSVGSGATNTALVTGDLETLGGPLATLDVTDPGVGFIDGSYSSVTVYPITSSGSGAELNVTISGNVITAATVTTGGSGYRVGDTIGITTADVGAAGGDSVLTLDTIGDTDTLFLTNVQGEKMVITESIKVYDTVTESLRTTGVDITTESEVLNPMYNGSIFVANIPNHGMEADNNVVSITDIQPDTIGSPLTQRVDVSSSSLTIQDSSSFSTFEGITTSIGYALVGGEIIEYSNSGSGTIGITSRGVDNSIISTHNAGERVFKYELSGVSLRRINREHLIPNDSLLGNTREINNLPIQISRSPRVSGRDQLSFNQEQTAGGAFGRSSQNYEYTRILPNLAAFGFGDSTSIRSVARTISGTSAGGSEVSFLDQGSIPVNLNTWNTFPSVRMVASQVNEIEYLQDLPRQKSFTLGLTLTSTDPNLSPVVDLQQVSLITSRNSLNKPITNYADDSRVNLLVGDPHASIYVSQVINLETPATSLEVIISAYRDVSADFRVLYRLYGPNSNNSTEPTWELFPGYTNMLDTTGDGVGNRIIDPSKNNGLPNARVRDSNIGEVLEYGYHVDELSEFSGFQLKIVFSGTNEARPPLFTDIRAIALA